MELQQAIRNRRSVRSYEPTPVDSGKLAQILSAAVDAPSAMNTQPWGFGIIEGVDVLRRWSERAKEALFETLGDRPWFAGLRDRIADPAFNLFYDAPALVLIYIRPGVALNPQVDGTLAAQNLMLMAHGLGLGTCWIGFAEPLFGRLDVQAELGLDPGHTLVAPIIVGVPRSAPPPVERRPPVVLFRR